MSPRKPATSDLVGKWRAALTTAQQECRQRAHRWNPDTVYLDGQTITASELCACGASRILFLAIVDGRLRRVAQTRMRYAGSPGYLVPKGAREEAAAFLGEIELDRYRPFLRPADRKRLDGRN